MMQTKSLLKVLMQLRPNAFSHRGGDTVVVERLSRGLCELGLEVEIDVGGAANPADYDLVHLFNFATPEITESYARRAHDANIPFVVTTLYEDAPRFYNQMVAQFVALEIYLASGQDRSLWPQLSQVVHDCEPCARLENSWTAAHAAALLVSGAEEERTLRRDFENLGRVERVLFGCDVFEEASSELFKKEFGVADFVLCVGRLETRKNQLTLLKALEDSELTLVLATGGFTYQPEYEEACRNFKRKGQTVFVGRLTDEMLASAYAACRVHVLPSWYELPGLVSLEAAHYGARIVTTEYGTARDYFGENAFYCEPYDDASIRNAIAAAQNANPTVRSKNTSWKSFSLNVNAIYQSVVC